MFAPKVAKPQAKPTAGSTSNLARQRSTLVAGRPAVQQALLLQRAIGAGLQANLRVGAPGDIHEQEADRIAGRALTKPMDPGVGATPRIQHHSEQATSR